MHVLQEAILIIAFGAFGGVLNALLAGEPLSFPHRITLPDKRTSLELGFFGNVLLGIAAAFIIWAFDLSNPEPKRQCATALLSGAGGSRILLDQLEKQKLVSSLKAIADAGSTTIEGLMSTQGCQNREVAYIMQQKENCKPTLESIKTIQELFKSIKSASSSSEIVKLSKQLKDLSERLSH